MKEKYFFPALFILIILTSVITLSSPAIAAFSAPKAFAPQHIYEFTPVPAGTIITHAFTIQNKGDAVLHIKRVKTG